jgi:tungstate transport system ATP-binding protein
MAEAAMFPLEARGLSVVLSGQRVLDRIDLTIGPHARLAVLGANGAGKSVLLRALHGLISPSSGQITWGGQSRRPREQAMVFQRPVMLRRSALANVEYPLAVRGIGKEDRRLHALQALERVGLSNLAHRQARVLSGGEQQRLALARAWALRPLVLFLDEPTASVDPAAAAEIERLMQEIHAAGAALVMTTHQLGLARRLSDEVVFLAAGRVTERTAAPQFFARPSSAEARRYLEEELP